MLHIENYNANFSHWTLIIFQEVKETNQFHKAMNFFSNKKLPTLLELNFHFQTAVAVALKFHKKWTCLSLTKDSIRN